MIWAFFGKILTSLPTRLLEKYLEYLAKKGTTAAEITIKRLNVELETRKLNAELIKVEHGWWVTAMIRPIFVYPLAFYYAKIVVWDMSLGLGTTPAMEGDVAIWSAWIIGSFFISRPFEKVARGLIHKNRKSQ